VLCYTVFEFEEVGLLEAIQPDRLLSVQLTPSNPKMVVPKQFADGPATRPLRLSAAAT
jgi:hypothetical protein